MIDCSKKCWLSRMSKKACLKVAGSYHSTYSELEYLIYEYENKDVSLLAKSTHQFKNFVNIFSLNDKLLRKCKPFFILLH